MAGRFGGKPSHPDSADSEATGKAAAYAALRKLRQICDLVEEISDPATGEHPQLHWRVEPDGLVLNYTGSPTVEAEFLTRLLALDESVER